MAGFIDPTHNIKILGELGRGTTGVVYEAQDTQNNRRLAVKALMLTPAYDLPNRTERFIKETHVIARLTCERQTDIPTLYMMDANERQPFYVREFVEGATLEQLAADGSITIQAGLEVIARVARVIQRVHDTGYVHRNLSAANILVTRDGSPRLIGFGRVGIVTGSPLLPPDSISVGTPADVDIRGLQDMLGWLYWTVRQPIPASLDRVSVPGTVATAGAFADILQGKVY